MQPLWMFVDQKEEHQLDFFDLCEPEVALDSEDLETQITHDGDENDET